jgi:hypothetical protein
MLYAMNRKVSIPESVTGKNPGLKVDLIHPEGLKVSTSGQRRPTNFWLGTDEATHHGQKTLGSLFPHSRDG